MDGCPQSAISVSVQKVQCPGLWVKEAGPRAASVRRWRLNWFRLRDSSYQHSTLHSTVILFRLLAVGGEDGTERERGRERKRERERERVGGGGRGGGGG